MSSKLLWQRLLSLFFLTALLIWTAVFTLPDRATHLYFFDVGQGDAIFIKTNTGKKILIDGGPSSSVVYHLGKTLPFYDQVLDLVILTHPHADHLTGLLDTLKRYQAKQIFQNGQSYESPEYKSWFAQTSSRAQTIEPGILYQDQWNCLEALYPWPETESIDPNELATVIRFTSFDHSTLLMSDAGFKTEYSLLQRYSLVSNILKVGHQGSKFSSSGEFLQNVTPQDSVITVGEDNPFGHPAPRVLEELEKVGSRIWRTDQDGTIEVVFYPQNYQIKTHAPQKTSPSDSS